MGISKNVSVAITKQLPVSQVIYDGHHIALKMELYVNTNTIQFSVEFENSTTSRKMSRQKRN